ncbi:hypothetical protein ACH5RR_031051 [Cinchona calisaya]|uniref:COBRA C-terminal domain-containing protein n=1 Tax=Cinchona calisaya TaxID=153742 RepID=A0ABD2YH62_9GENT
MDPSKSISAFQINVFKMPPDNNRSHLNPPQNWNISGTVNPDYQCGPPVRVSPSEFPDPSGLLLNTTAVASWQVVCNITQPSPRCCVSFSAYNNELFSFRTQLVTAWADLHHFPVSNPLPCAHNCGVSINWHLPTDNRGEWSARITIFNWDGFSFADWFAAVEFDKAAAVFEEVYSFNGTTLDGVNNTVIMQDRPGLNYLVAEADGAELRKDYRVPGK